MINISHYMAFENLNHVPPGGSIIGMAGRILINLPHVEEAPQGRLIAEEALRRPSSCGPVVFTPIVALGLLYVGASYVMGFPPG